jgi:hypothetical protein
MFEFNVFQQGFSNFSVKNIPWEFYSKRRFLALLACTMVMPVTPALRGLRQEDHKLQANLGYTVRPCLK